MLSVTIHRCRVSSIHTAGAPTEHNIAPLQHLICFCGPFAAIIRTTQLAITWKLTVNCCCFTRLRVVLPHLCSSQCQYNRVYDFFSGPTGSRQERAVGPVRKTLYHTGSQKGS